MDGHLTTTQSGLKRKRKHNSIVLKERQMDREVRSTMSNQQRQNSVGGKKNGSAELPANRRKAQ